MPAADQIAATLAHWVHSLQPDDVPADVGLRARHLMLDAVGCALAARREPFAARFTAAAQALATEGSDDSQSNGAGHVGRRGVIGHHQRLPLRDAVLMNGVLAHGLDYDDTHIAGVVHLTVAVLPALLGLAAQRRSSGAALQLAYVTAIETGARLAMAARGGFHSQGFHPTGVVGALAAAWGAGKLLGLDQTALVHAQGAALSMASGSLQFIEDGAWTKRLHAGWAAQAGVTAATLAAHGVLAPAAPFTGRYGLYHSFLDEQGRAGVDMSLATHGLPGRADNPIWQLSDIAIKPFAMCHFAHAAIDAAIALHRRGLAADQVRHIEVLVPQAAVPLVCEPAQRKRRPGNDYEAKFSMPYAVACGLMRGRLGLQELLPQAYQDEAVQALMDKVHYSVDPDATFPRHYSAELRVSLMDGSQQRHREAVNRGHAERPLTNGEVRAKFDDNAGLHFAPAQAKAIAEALLALHEMADVRALENLLAVDPLR